MPSAPVLKERLKDTQMVELGVKEADVLVYFIEAAFESIKYDMDKALPKNIDKNSFFSALSKLTSYLQEYEEVMGCID